MKRISAAVALVGVLIGVPLVLLWLAGSPTVPSFHGVRLSDTYMPLDPVLTLVGLLAWILWVYIAAASLLRVVAVSLGRGPGGLVTASGMLMPKPLRIWIDLVIGGALLAASLNPRTQAQPSRAHVVAAASTKPRSNAQAPQGAKERHDLYRVRAGDSLWRIAERKLGSGFRWREIFELNRDKHFGYGQRLTDPRLIRTGWTLELPNRPVRLSPHGVISPNHSGPASVTPSRELVPRIAPVNKRTAAHRSSRGARPVTRLPSGLVVATSFASGLVTAELLALLRRRRRYRPLIDTVEQAEDSELVRELRRNGATPEPSILEAAIGALTDAWMQRFNESPPLIAALERERRMIAFLADTGKPMPSEVGGSFSPHITFRTREGRIEAELTGPFPPHLGGVSPAHELVPVCHSSDAVLHLSPLGLGVISFEGASAQKLVRQMLIAAATSVSPDELQIILLGAFGELDVAKDLPHVVRAASWDDSSEALHDVQAELLRRARAFFDQGVETVRAYRAQRPDDRLADLLLVASSPPQALRGIVEAVGTEAARLGAALIAVEWTPERSSMHSIVGDRVEFEHPAFPDAKGFAPFTLDAAAARDAIGVARAAHVELEERHNEDVVSTEEGVSSLPEIESGGNEQADFELPKATPNVASLPETLPPPKEGSGVCAEIRCLGPIIVARSDGSVPGKGWRAPAKELLVYLALHPDGVHKERLAEVFFTDMPTKKALDLIARAASVIRTRVRTSGDDRKYVEVEGETWRLERGAWQVDAWEMERLITQDVSPDESIGNLRAALALYRGEFCDDAYFAWAQSARERYRALFLRGSARLAELLSDSSQHEDALLVLDRAIEIEPLCEDLYRRAMAIEASVARRKEALERYGRLKRLLETELNCEPDSETEQIARDIERSQARERVNVAP